LFCFQLGILAPEAARFIRLLPRPVTLIGFALAVIVLGISTNLSRMSIMPEHATKEGIASFVIIAVVLSGELGALGLLRRETRWLGRISYSLYVFHYPIIATIERKAIELLSAEWCSSHTTVLGLIALPIALPTCLCAGWLGWRYFEVPFQSWGAAFARTILPPTAPDCAAIVSPILESSLPAVVRVHNRAEL
jgi:peptidoglycan/LPS O-acetylase OafA/YrhL